MFRKLSALTVLLAACSTASSSPSTTNAPAAIAGTAAPTTTITTTTSTTVPPTTASTTTTTLLESGSRVPFTSLLAMEVTRPGAGSGPWPTVVLFHGGGWVAGGPSDVAALARRISDRGFVVFNAPYRLALQGGGYPESIEDAACAVSVAHASASEFGGDPDRLIVAGYSAGAHLGSIVSLAAEEFPGDCVADALVLPAGFAGIAGTYDTDPLGILMLPFFGTDPNEDPEPWQKGNPITHLGKNADLVWTLVVGANDLTRGSTEAFHTALTEAGYRSTLQVLEGVNHFTIVDQSEVADVIVELAAGL